MYRLIFHKRLTNCHLYTNVHLNLLLSLSTLKVLSLLSTIRLQKTQFKGQFNPNFPLNIPSKNPQFLTKTQKMSGGVGPISDIRLPKEEEGGHKQHEDIKDPFSKKQSTASVRRGGGFFSLRQLNVLATVVVLSASGMVGVEDFAFVIFSLAYIHLISKIAFPVLSPGASSPVFGPNNKILGVYVSVGALIGLFLPIIYIFEGIFEGDKEGIKAAAPHVFLLASQVFMEGLTFSGQFSIPVRAFVPVFYNARRIFSIAEWLRAEISKVDEQHSGGEWRLYVGRGLAIANLAFWCFNLFGFLLPFYLPKAFKKYYSEEYKGKD